MYNVSLFGIVTLNPPVQQTYPNKKLTGKKEMLLSLITLHTHKSSVHGTLSQPGQTSTSALKGVMSYHFSPTGKETKRM
jgi:hypothetical protein